MADYAHVRYFEFCDCMFVQYTVKQLELLFVCCTSPRLCMVAARSLMQLAGKQCKRPKIGGARLLIAYSMSSLILLIAKWLPMQRLSLLIL